MASGAWFLSDEFNLSQPAVMAMLTPLLEGASSITDPVSGLVITAQPGFR